MKIIELVIDELQEDGVEAISVVESPAIEENFVALKSKSVEVKFEKIDGEKKILMGPILIPNKPIFRLNGEDEYYIYFSRDTEESFRALPTSRQSISEYFRARNENTRSYPGGILDSRRQG